MNQEPLPVPVELLRAAVSMIPVFGSPIEILLTSAISRDLARVQQALDPSIAAIGSPEEVQTLLMDNERLEVLFAEGMRAASSAGDEAKRRLLGEALCNALLDEAVVDESELLVATLRELWPPHVRALQRLRSVWDSYSNEEHAGHRLPDRSLLDDTHAAWRREPLPVTAALIRTGTAVAPQSTYVIGRPVKVGISPFGISILDALRRSERPG